MSHNQFALDRLIGRENVLVYLPEGGEWGADEIILSADNTNFNYSRTMDTADVTAGNERARTRKATIEDMTWSANLFAADREYEGVIRPEQRGEFYVMKNGVGPDKPILGFETLITGFSEDMPFDGAIEIDLAGERQGPMILDVGSRTGAAPTITSVTPATAVEGATATTIAVVGTGYNANSVVYWRDEDGEEHALVTTQDETDPTLELEAIIPASLLVDPTTAEIFVRNFPGLVDSDTEDFTVTAAP
jgi:hypothetical protein